MKKNIIQKKILLTEKVRASGWAAKLNPGVLDRIVKGLSVKKHKNLLVGLENSDDAGVYQLNKETALIQTLDFLTPITDDPYEFGQIAAANALSDVYSMGGYPVTAMNIVCFPCNDLPEEILQETLAGGLDKIHEAGALLVGGHSVDDKEFKYGLSVTGIVQPNKILTNGTLKKGDLLILTKPLGIGIIAKAIKGKVAKSEDVKNLVKITSTLNKKAAEIMTDFNPHACTDVTGFGLLGHALEMAAAGKKTITIFSDSVEIIDSAKKYARMGLVPAGGYKTREFCKENIFIDASVKREIADILFDPQTSGGLIISFSSKDAKQCLSKMQDSGINASIIGEVTDEHLSGKLNII